MPCLVASGTGIGMENQDGLLQWCVSRFGLCEGEKEVKAACTAGCGPEL